MGLGEVSEVRQHWPVEEGTPTEVQKCGWRESVCMRDEHKRLGFDPKSSKFPKATWERSLVTKLLSPPASGQ
jgi:hypothetical protein